MYKKISFIASAVIWILLPKCSACLMAYMGIFSALGLGQWINHPYTVPVIQLLLFVNILAVLYLAIKERQYWYAAISFAGMLVFMINKWYIHENSINIITGIILVAAALRIRLLRVGKKKCVFDNEGDASCTVTV